ncbi:uncharacterized protein LOC119098448 [Pollicipes pollicipes]|uniref:uncharacterized protein LOC119098448 n=1 Tax=Pollicipes pollicipes TaxID=41117 RepID=UPI0018855CC6|nr:uncharacterized protein LOC119098448 [Pollicipes pollicipes]
MWHAVALLLCQLAPAPAAAGIDCYACGGLVSDQPGGSCREFRNALTWSLFTVTCADDEICAKTASLYTGQEDREFRGCAAREAWFGLRHPLGCRPANTSDSQTEFCLCDTRLCNAGTRRRPPAALWMLAVLALALALALRPER